MRPANELGLHQISEIARTFRQNGILPDVRIPRVGVQRLWSMLNAHRPHKHWTALLQVVASKSWIYPSVLDRIVCESNDSGVLNAVACSPRVRLATLRKLESGDCAESVRQHARISIVSRRLERMSGAEFLKLLRAHSGDDGSSLGIRGLIARSEYTPSEVLDLILFDDADFVREAAAVELRRRNESR